MTAAPAIEPGLPLSASLVAPITPEEKAATEAFLGWSAEVLDWGRANAAQAEAARAWCTRLDRANGPAAVPRNN